MKDQDDVWSKPNRNDWFVCRSGILNRSQLLALVFTAKDMIRNPESSIKKTDYIEAFQYALDVNLTRVESLRIVEWEKLRVIIRNMKTRCSKDPSGFNNFLTIAKAMWRDDNSRI